MEPYPVKRRAGRQRLTSSGQDDGNRRGDPWERAGIAAIALLVTAGAIAQFVNYGFDLRSGVLDSTGDGGAFGVVGMLAVACAAVSAWRHWIGVPTRDAAMAILPFLVTFLAVDKVLRLHDHIANWRVYYAPVVFATFATLAIALRRLPPHTRPLLAFGLALLTLALLMHLIPKPVFAAVGVERDSWWAQIAATAKHGAETAGWLLIALGLAISRRRHQASPRIRIPRN